MDIYEFLLQLIKLTFTGVILIVLVRLVFRPMIKIFFQKPDLEELSGVDTERFKDAPELELEIPVSEEGKTPSHNQIINLAVKDPLKTASLVRTWLQDKNS